MALVRSCWLKHRTVMLSLSSTRDRSTQVLYIKQPLAIAEGCSCVGCPSPCLFWVLA